MFKFAMVSRASAVCAALLWSAAVAGVALPQMSAHAAVKPPKAKTVHNGKVKSVDTTGSTITIEHGKKAAHTFTVTKDTAITVDGAADKALADVTAGMHARITTATKKSPVATAIDATTRKKKKSK